MCRSTGFNRRFNDRNRLKIKSFIVKFPSLNNYDSLESLTLLYLPRIDETELEIDGSKIRPNAPAFVTLHRAVVAADTTDIVFGSRERVRASEGVRFVVYAGEEKLLKGIFRKDDDWKLECKCESENFSSGGGGGGGEGHVAVVEVCVGVEGHVALHNRVEMVVRGGRKKNKRKIVELEEIPEVDDESDGGGDCGCSCTCDEDHNQEEEEGEGSPSDLEMEVEGVKWAVDMGIWVMCFGVGYLISKATAKNFRRIRKL